jgi:hypothetical protein
MMYFLQESALFLQERPPAFIVTYQLRAGYNFEKLVWCGDIGETKHSLPIETYSKHQQNVSIRSSNRNFSGLEKRKVYSRYTDFSTKMVLFARKVRRIGKSAKAAT